MYNGNQMSLLSTIKKTVRGIIGSLAQIIHENSRGKIRPHHITYASVLLHAFVALAIINNQLAEAALLLVVFGLMDSLDGELARLQNSQSDSGVLLDATADRIKEVIVYSAIGFWLAEEYGSGQTMVAIAALGGSLLVSYVKAKGEMIVSSRHQQLTVEQTNRLFSIGLMQFEVRTALLAIGLVFDSLLLFVSALAILCWLTAFDRLIVITKHLDRG